MALPISCGLDTQVSVPGSCRFGEARSIQLYQGIFGAKEVRSSGVERADRPRSLDRVDTAEAVGIGLCRNGEGEDGNTSSPAFQRVTDKAVLGQSLLDKGVLR